MQAVFDACAKFPIELQVVRKDYSSGTLAMKTLFLSLKSICKQLTLRVFCKHVLLCLQACMSYLPTTQP